jgi:hypothetical protein
MKIKEIVAGIHVRYEQITDHVIRQDYTSFFNIVESLNAAITSLKKLVQDLKDENNKLKGEQGKPNIRPQKKDSNHSSDKDRKSRNKKKNNSRKKRKPIEIDQTVKCAVNKDILPMDAQNKGYTRRVVQDIKISRHNIEFILEVYYSPSEGKRYVADLPLGYSGKFGSNIKALIVSLYHDSNITQPSFSRFCETFGIFIGNGSISRLLTDNHEIFHEEKENIVDAGLQGPYQQTDDTMGRVNGINHHVHILSNPLYTAYFTRKKKDRLTLLEIFCRGELKYTFNPNSLQLMADMGLPQKWLSLLASKNIEGTLTRSEIDEVLIELFPNKKKQKTNRRYILEASALVYYHNSEHAIKHLMCDDAAQFNYIAEHKSLCWIHEGRHYKKLMPIIPEHQKILEEFSDRFWDFYQELLEYTENPTPEIKIKLNTDFDILFSHKTGYEQLDKRISLTLNKKEALLLPLQFPFLPLHNNDAENAAQHQARLRDIHLQTRNAKGTKAKDTFATIVKTARKLNVNLFNYFYDRISGAFKMQSLADIILEKYEL